MYFSGRICENAPLSNFITYSPVELAYSLAMISATEKYSLIPRWVIMNYPKVDEVLKALRNTSCGKCGYCKSELDPKNISANTLDTLIFVHIMVSRCRKMQ